jgi:hypothetical protein
MGGAALAYLTFGCRTLTCLVFLVAVVAKARDFAGFEKSMRGLVPLSGAVARPAAALVLVIEGLTALMLVIPRTVVAGFTVGLALDLAFTAALALALRRGATASCHCFGVTERPLRARHVVRDVVLAAVAAAGLVGAVAADGPGPLAGLLLSGLAGALGALVVVLLDDIVELFVSDSEEIPWPISSPQ